MVKIYSNKNLLDIPVLEGPGAKGYFVFKVGGSGVSAEGISCMKEIDEAEFVEGSRDTIRTPFGVTSVNNLSTGCLTLLNLLHIRDKGIPLGVDVTDCGPNALDKAFELADGADIHLVLSCLDISDCKDKSFIVNDKYRADNIYDLIDILENDGSAS